MELPWMARERKVLRYDEKGPRPPTAAMKRSLLERREAS